MSCLYVMLAEVVGFIGKERSLGGEFGEDRPRLDDLIR